MKELDTDTGGLVFVEIGEKFHFHYNIQLSAYTVHCVEHWDPAGHHCACAIYYYLNF